jgi:hypothetical protein
VAQPMFRGTSFGLVCRLSMSGKPCSLPAIGTLLGTPVVLAALESCILCRSSTHRTLHAVVGVVDELRDHFLIEKRLHLIQFSALTVN